MADNQSKICAGKSDRRSRQNRRTYLSIVSAVFVLVVIVGVTLFYYNYIQKQLFDERNSHLTEITMKVAD